jgi:cyclopropane fatty-acyl-phospholipid synthase-like methyltransferase
MDRSPGQSPRHCLPKRLRRYLERVGAVALRTDKSVRQDDPVTLVRVNGPFDLRLFKELNDEYSDKRVVKAPRQFDPESQAKEAQSRGGTIERTLGVSGSRLLEVGCGRANVGRHLATTYDCEVVGLDKTPFREWEEPLPANLSMVAGDVSDPELDIGSFDAIYSFSVWEHLTHPYAALANCFRWLNAGGAMFIHAQLHRGPKASHRYREVFFPWPHLLFTPEIFEAYYMSINMKPARPAWVNKLTYSQYVDHFNRLGYSIRSCRATGSEFDEVFYERFHEQLSPYPKWDLAQDAITTVLQRPIELDATTNEDDGTAEEAQRERILALENQLASMARRKSLRTADWIGRQVRRLPGVSVDVKPNAGR